MKHSLHNSSNKHLKCSLARYLGTQRKGSRYEYFTQLLPDTVAKSLWETNLLKKAWLSRWTCHRNYKGGIQIVNKHYKNHFLWSQYGSSVEKVSPIVNSVDSLVVQRLPDQAVWVNGPPLHEHKCQIISSLIII